MRNWRVYRIDSVGEVIATVSEPLDPSSAERRAGRLRDEMSDEDVGAGLNYEARRDETW